jgi:hypothetical protein
MNQPYNPMQPPMQYPMQPQMHPQMQPQAQAYPPMPMPMQPVPYPLAPQMTPAAYQPAFHRGPYPYPAGTYPMDIVSPNTNPMPWMGPYHDPSMSGDDDEENILLKKYGGLPVWGWALAAAAVGGVGFVVYHKVLKKNGASDTPSSDSDASDGDEDAREVRSNKSTSWSPSRSGFGAEIEQGLKAEGIHGVRVYIDADEAAKTIKTPSPLITLRAPNASSVLLNGQISKMLKAEGLRPVETADGIIGLYPDKSNKRGKAWEQYIDDLRDEGQKV